MKAWYDELDEKVNAIQAINTTDLDKKKLTTRQILKILKKEYPTTVNILLLIVLMKSNELRCSGSLASMVNASNVTTCISLNNHPCMTRPTLIDSNPH